MRLLAGRYRLLEPVGRGGTAVVWRAVDELLNRPVAVKMLAPRLAHDRQSRALIRAEAQIAAQLNHPHVANVYDYGEARADGPRRVPYLVLEFVDGETLAGRLHRRGAMDWPEAVRVCADVAAALAATHAAGLVHRDVKPSNVLLSPAGVKLVDLGIALAVGAESANSRGEVRGTPSYMAPEQLAGGAAVPASDVYALGLVLYACLTGRALHRTDGTRPEPVDPGAAVRVLAAAPEEVRELCRRCLAPAPADRPTSAEAARLLAGTAGVPDTGRAAVAGTAVTGNPAVAGPAARASSVPAQAPATPRPTVVAAWTARWAAGRGGRRPLRQAVLVAALPVAALAAVLGAQLPGLTAADGAAEGAGTNALPVPRTVSGCLANYTSHRAADGTFSAELTVRVSDDAGSAARRVLSFTLPAGQRLTSAGGNGRPHQSGRRVTLRLPDPARGGRPVTLVLRGTYDATTSGAADGFTVDGRPCERASTSVILASPVPATDGAASTAAEDRARGNAASDDSGTGSEDGPRGPATATTRPGGRVSSSPGAAPTASTAPTPSGATPTSPAPATSTAVPAPTGSPAPATSTAVPAPTGSPDPEATGTGDVSPSPTAEPSSSVAATPSPTS